MTLIPGKFYWVKITNDPDYEDWERDWTPARYAGYNEWNYLGVDGESDWAPSFIGNEITID